MTDMGNNDGERPAADQPLRYLCEECISAFQSNHRRCPTCGAERPGEEWRETKNFPDVWLGRTIGRRYRLLQRLGKGTFGSVYRARRPHLADTYAVKIISLDGSQFESDGPSLRERVEREVRILSSISTPHIVSFHDYIELNGGAVAVVMDFVRGQTLGDLLHDVGRLDMVRAVQFGIEIATGLREVHRRGVVHRDLKPENVMIQNMGGRREFVEILDFGIARFEDEVSRTVGFIGTPRYTSPEQARGESSDRKSDIYNLGMLLFHMLTGEPPFNQDTVADLLAAHSREEAPKMRSIAPDREFPRELESTIRAMLAKDPADRPRDMQVVIDSLEPIRKRLEVAWTRRDDRALDSRPPAHGTGEHRAQASSHVTDEYDPLPSEQQEDEEEPEEIIFAERPPSNVYDVTSKGEFIYVDESNRIRRQVKLDSDTHEDTIIQLPEPVSSIAFDHGRSVLVGMESGDISRLDIVTGNLEAILRDTGFEAVTGVAETPDGEFVVAGFADGAVRFGPPRRPKQWKDLAGGPTVVSVAILRDGSCIAAARENNCTDIFIVSRSVESPTTRIHHDEQPLNIYFSPDGYLIAVRFDDVRVELFSALTGAHVSNVENPTLRTSSIFEDNEK